MQDEPATVEDLLSHAEWMRELARRLLGNRDEADEVVQEAWVSALRLPPSRRQTLRPWMATVILNLVRTRARRRARAHARAALLASPDPPPATDELLARRETERRLAQLVLALEEPYRRTVLHRFHDGQSSAEIARREGVPEGTVRWRLKHGLDELRRGFAAEDGGKNRLAALIPIAGPPASSPLLLGGAEWLARTGAFVQGKAVLTGTSAVAVLAAVAVSVQPSPQPPRERPVPRVIAAALPAPAPPAGAVLPPATPSIDLDGPQAATPPATLPLPAPTELVAIAGIVRDSRGVPAVRVPVTLRTLDGSGAADRTTVTDDAGRFTYRVPRHSGIVITAELKGEPAARLAIDAPTKLAGRLDVSASLTSTAASFATIDVALDARPRKRPAARVAKPGPGREPLSRWCCREAFLSGDMVYGRACLRFDDSRESDQIGCDLYGLKAQVSCHHYTEGGFSTADLTRTDRLGCDGQLL